MTKKHNSHIFEFKELINLCYKHAACNQMSYSLIVSLTQKQLKFISWLLLYFAIRVSFLLSFACVLSFFITLSYSLVVLNINSSVKWCTFLLVVCNSSKTVTIIQVWFQPFVKSLVKIVILVSLISLISIISRFRQSSIRWTIVS